MTTATISMSKKAVGLLLAFLTIFATLTLNPIEAHAAASVSGTVTESVGSKPIGGARVRLMRTPDPAATVEVNTAADGTFTLTAATTQTDWQVVVTKTGYNDGVTAAFTAGGSAVTGKNVSLVTSTTAATVSGTIRTINSSNVTALASGATVVAYRGSVSSDTVTTTTDANGAYSLSLPAGTYTLGFSLAGTVSQYLGNVATLAAGTTFDIASAGTATKDATLTLQGTLSGTTTPVSTDVTIYKTTGEQVATTTSNGSGVYSIANIDPGTYYVAFSKTGYITEYWNDAPAFLSSTGVSITAGNTTGSISPTLVANPGSGTVDATGVTATVTGSPIEGTTLTASSSGWLTAGTTVSYQWQYSADGTTNWTNITDAVLSSYVIKAVDATRYLRVSVVGNKLGYVSSSAVNSAATAVVTHAFTTKPTPTITGIAAVGQTLTAVTGTWLPTPDSFTYQWYYGGAIIPSATNSTLDVTNFVAGWAITVTVTAVKTGYPNTAMTSAATAVVGQLMTVTPTPTISGTPAVGKTLTAVTGAWTPSSATFTYQWKRNGTDISGATGSTYSPVAADVGSYLTVTVVGSATNYTSTTVNSASTSAVLGQLTKVTPTIAGNTTVGSVLTATPGTWGPGTVALTYQWYRNAVAITGATAATYTLAADDDTKALTVTVTGTASGYDTATATSANFLVGKQFTLHPTPTIKGNNWLGQTLTATIGKWDTGATLTHQWLRNGVAITGARWHTYKLTSADVGKVITFTTTASAAGFITKTETSAATKVILNGKPFTKAPTPTISGNARVGANLTANLGNWSPLPSKVTYQWLRGGVAIPGATKATYKATAADKGYFLSVRIVATKSGFATTTKTSGLTISIK